MRSPRACVRTFVPFAQAPPHASLHLRTKCELAPLRTCTGQCSKCGWMLVYGTLESVASRNPFSIPVLLSRRSSGSYRARRRRRCIACAPFRLKIIQFADTNVLAKWYSLRRCLFFGRSGKFLVGWKCGVVLVEGWILAEMFDCSLLN